ncbi:PREDICTED: selenocysteine insertion sequence-binding protein 2-like isoform X2 [Polistes dominula]|uniref:Selenocysteine insertion sequence-binding protein 2-like isoform X2 n=1 Tax=Polistes dominula TaxID=743375 RepID=A0ABM1HZD9_POLDO|nr:PREDICTED: selenocysteine insertion sequence-binding protein 2-like isoform X2 [Polistes dominula]
MIQEYSQLGQMCWVLFREEDTSDKDSASIQLNSIPQFNSQNQMEHNTVVQHRRILKFNDKMAYSMLKRNKFCKKKDDSDGLMHELGKLFEIQIKQMKEEMKAEKLKKQVCSKKIYELERSIDLMEKKFRCYKIIKERREKGLSVNNINFNSLKIKSDPKIDIDYVKRMSTLNIYDKDYRHSIGENISEDTVQHRPDLTQKFDQLNISNVQNEHICISPNENSTFAVNDLGVSLNSNLSFNDENNVDVKPNMLFDLKYSKNFREYCNNLVTLSLNVSLDKFLSEIRRLQSKLYNRNENKGKYKRRYYSGLKEVNKHVMLKKVRFVIIAPDIENIVSAGGLNEEVDKLLEICRKNETPYCFGLRRRKLGYYAHGNGFVSCIGISNYANAEELFWNVLVEVIKARNSFEKLQGKSKEMVNVSKLTQENGLLTENIKVVLKSLTMIT